MAQNVSEFMLDRLADWGVDRIFGYPGDGINGIMGALDRKADRIRFIQARHEEMAAFMACAHVKCNRPCSPRAEHEAGSDELSGGQPM